MTLSALLVTGSRQANSVRPTHGSLQRYSCRNLRFSFAQDKKETKQNNKVFFVLSQDLVRCREVTTNVLNLFSKREKRSESPKRILIPGDARSLSLHPPIATTGLCVAAMRSPESGRVLTSLSMSPLQCCVKERWIRTQRWHHHATLHLKRLKRKPLSARSATRWVASPAETFQRPVYLDLPVGRRRVLVEEFVKLTGAERSTTDRGAQGPRLRAGS